MKLAQFFQRYEFHDSSLEGMHYDSDNRRCILKITLLNYDQSWYRQGDPEFVLGNAVFTGVRMLEVEPEQGLFQEDGTSDAEILQVRQVGEEALDCWQFAVTVPSYVRYGDSSFFALTLCADEVEWQAVAEYATGDDLPQ
jgi:hypothetical protein